MPCESLDSREFSRIFLKFHFSISISSHFYFTFTSRSRFPVIFISLSFLEKSERDKNFTLFLEKKEWNFIPSFMKNLTILRSRVKNPKQIMSGIMNGDTQLFIQDTTTNNSRFRFLLPILKVLHKKLNAFGACVPWVSQTNIKSFRAQARIEQIVERVYFIVKEKQFSQTFSLPNTSVMPVTQDHYI